MDRSTGVVVRRMLVRMRVDEWRAQGCSLKGHGNRNRNDFPHDVLIVGDGDSPRQARRS
jgi:hypothetical protein